MIGLGDIAEKAYLPIIANLAEIDLALCTRDVATLNRLGGQYRVKTLVTDIDAVIASGVQAAFIHTATDAHAAIAERMLRQGIDVYVDKPLSYSLDETRRLTELATSSGRILMMGFNRRFAPMVRDLSVLENRKLILMQKNRVGLPASIRQFVYDDFIHVIDTMRFLLPGSIRNLHVSSRVGAGLLHHVTVQLEGDGCSAIGIMNRDSGVSEETLEVMCPGQKWRVEGLNNKIRYAKGNESREYFKDWDPVLARRGFPQIVEHFLDCVREKRQPDPSASDSLETHLLCEQVVAKIEQAQ
jgi:virulence factor